MLKQLPKRTVIAHRGTTYWAPEETEAAMRWARNIGVDYLEFDLQRTKDGYLIALHDENLQRTTNVAEKFPERKDQPVSSFTYEELMTLDAGTWFNEQYPDKARPRFSHLDLLTFEDIVQIAEGKRIKRDENGKRIFTTKEGLWTSVYETDPSDDGNRPGIYVETKIPSFFPGIEEDLKKELVRLGWYGNKKKIPIKKDRVNVANSAIRVILQTFSKESLRKLYANFGETLPICFQMWHGNEPDDLPATDAATYQKAVELAIQNGASILGPSIGGEPNKYSDLLMKEHSEIINATGAYVHAYSFDTKEQLEQYGALTNGIFSNKAEEAIKYYKLQEKEKANTAELALQTLKSLGY